jgi:plasmid stabilization system protein ParE
VRYRISPHPKVQLDFANILSLIGGYAGYLSGRKKVAEVKQSISNLKDFPHIGTVRDDITAGLRAIPSGEKATICFTVDDETRTVNIICVTYAGQDWQKIAKTRK